MGKSMPVRSSLLLCALLAAPVLAQQPKKEVSPEFGVSQARLTTLVVETVYPMKVMSYEGQRIIVPRKRGTKSGATPEDVLVDMVSSIKAKDFEWNSALWTPASLAGMKQRDAANGKTPADWIKLWENDATRSFELLTRVEYGKYVLIEYSVKESTGKQVYKDTIATEKLNGKWYLTQALAADPLLMHWNAPGGRVQVAPDTVFNK